MMMPYLAVAVNSDTALKAYYTQAPKVYRNAFWETEYMYSQTLNRAANMGCILHVTMAGFILVYHCLTIIMLGRGCDP